MRVFQRAIRRSSLPVQWTSGFNPRPRMSFPLALGLGIEGRREVMELELEEPVDPEQVPPALNPYLPTGVRVLAAEELAQGERTRVLAVEYLIELPAGRSAPRERIEALFGQERLDAARGRHGSRRVDIRPYLDAIAVQPAPEGDRLLVKFKVTPQGSGRPRDVLALLDAGSSPGEPAPRVSRTGIILAPSPLGEETPP